MENGENGREKKSKKWSVVHSKMCELKATNEVFSKHFSEIFHITQRHSKSAKANEYENKKMNVPNTHTQK